MLASVSLGESQLEYDWVVAPGADPRADPPRRIQWRSFEVVPVRLDEESGDLEVTGASGEVCLHKPVAYQVVAGERVTVGFQELLDRCSFTGLNGKRNRAVRLESLTKLLPA